ncbi:MAG: IS30 family transposase [Patescibacteria group bacterium]
MYTYFTKESRIALAALRRAGHSSLNCAEELGMDKSSVNRELKRHSCPDGVYRGAKAHKQYLEKRKEAKSASRKIKNDSKLKSHIRKRLKKKDSPEQIAGRNKLNGTYQYVCAETIYQWIFQEEKQFTKYLRRIGHKGKYRRKRGTKVREKARDEAKIKRIDIRPPEVEERSRIGDYEGDTILGKDKRKRLLSNVDRFSGYGMLDRLDLVKAEIVRRKTAARFKCIPSSKKHTYTYDNGVELGEEDGELEKMIKMEVYRAYPYHSWERGSNENYNGLVRDFFPKGIDFGNITDKEVKRVERNLNHRPRKRLGYLTPHEVYVLGMMPGATQTRI